jgi:hypothetical protein
MQSSLIADSTLFTRKENREKGKREKGGLISALNVSQYLQFKAISFRYTWYIIS